MYKFKKQNNIKFKDICERYQELKSYGKKRILVVDDEEFSLSAL